MSSTKSYVDVYLTQVNALTFNPATPTPPFQREVWVQLIGSKLSLPGKDSTGKCVSWVYLKHKEPLVQIQSLLAKLFSKGFHSVTTKGPSGFRVLRAPTTSRAYLNTQELIQLCHHLFGAFEKPTGGDHELQIREASDTSWRNNPVICRIGVGSGDFINKLKFFGHSRNPELEQHLVNFLREHDLGVDTVNVKDREYLCVIPLDLWGAEPVEPLFNSPFN